MHDDTMLATVGDRETFTDGSEISFCFAILEAKDRFFVAVLNPPIDLLSFCYAGSLSA